MLLGKARAVTGESPWEKGARFGPFAKTLRLETQGSQRKEPLSALTHPTPFSKWGPLRPPNSPNDHSPQRGFLSLVHFCSDSPGNQRGDRDVPTSSHRRKPQAPEWGGTRSEPARSQLGLPTLRSGNLRVFLLEDRRGRSRQEGS